MPDLPAFDDDRPFPTIGLSALALDGFGAEIINVPCVRLPDRFVDESYGPVSYSAYFLATTYKEARAKAVALSNRYNYQDDEYYYADAGRPEDSEVYRRVWKKE